MILLPVAVRVWHLPDILLHSVIEICSFLSLWLSKRIFTHMLYTVEPLLPLLPLLHSFRIVYMGHVVIYGYLWMTVCSVSVKLLLLTVKKKM